MVSLSYAWLSLAKYQNISKQQSSSIFITFILRVSSISYLKFKVGFRYMIYLISHDMHIIAYQTAKLDDNLKLTREIPFHMGNKEIMYQEYPKIYHPKIL